MASRGSIFVQWSLANPQDWVELNLESNKNQWRQLAKKPKPVGGETIDNTPGWIMSMCVQGVIFGGFDGYAAEFVAPNALRISGWCDDPDDYPSDRFYAMVYTFLPLAPDPRFGGQLNTRQSVVLYAAPTLHEEIVAGGIPSNVTLRTWAEFVRPAENITKYGIWMPDSLSERHTQVRRQINWQEWQP